MESDLHPYPCELVDLVPVPALLVRTRTSIQGVGQFLNTGFPEIASLLERQGLEPSGAPYALYSNVEGGDLDLEFGIPADLPAKGSGRIQKGLTPAGRAASCIYQGPYDKVGPAYSGLLSWMAEEGYVAGGTALEIFLDNPEATLPEALRTRIHLLLAGA